MSKYSKVKAVIAWRTAYENSEATNYFSFRQISQKELEDICSEVNNYFYRFGSVCRVANSMGEIIPVEA